MASRPVAQPQGRNLVVCCDGTGNQVETNLSNVLKLYRIATKSRDQICFYHPGVGTIGMRGGWGRTSQKLKEVWGLATGWGLNPNLLEAYAFLCREYRPGDRVFLFGFSRGSYTVRALAGMVYLIGLLRPEQLNLCTYALSAYIEASDKDSLDIAWQFQRVVDGRRIPIHFLGVWDTVASVLVPRPGSPKPRHQFLPYTKVNPAVRVFRQAYAVDERRRMFRNYKWRPGQDFAPDPWDEGGATPQNAREVWFSGVHADIGGGYPEAESQLAKFPLIWLIDEAARDGLAVNRSLLGHLAHGAPLPDGRRKYVAPDASAPMHDSLMWWWRPLEYVPKANKWRRYPTDGPEKGFYLPLAEPRRVPEGALLHSSVVSRLASNPDYRPVNLPAKYLIEP